MNELYDVRTKWKLIGPVLGEEKKAQQYGTPNETKISKRKRQRIVSESSFNVAVDYDFGLF